MPKLSQIELYLDGTYSKSEKIDFIFKSRCICGFLERALVNLGFQTTLSRINIKCSREVVQAEARQLKASPFLEVSITYDFPSLSGLNLVSTYLEFSNVILLGLKSAESYMPVPHDFCREQLERFMEGECVNQWIHVDKTWKKISCRSVIEAEIKSDKFSLHQTIYRDGVVIERIQLTETKPREMLFFPFLGKLRLDKDGYIYYENKERKISKFNLINNKITLLH